jgi:hypothetical protein
MLTSPGPVSNSVPLAMRTGVELEVGRLAQLGPNPLLEVRRPTLARVQRIATDLAAADLDDLGFTERKLANLVRRAERLVLRRHGNPLAVECPSPGACAHRRPYARRGG